MAARPVLDPGNWRAGFREFPDRPVARLDPVTDRYDPGGGVDPTDLADLAGLDKRDH